MTHTPGPWEILNQTESGEMLNCVVPVNRMNDWPIAIITENTDIYSSNESEANARLIAAAPELLEALKGTMDVINDYLTIHDKLACEDYLVKAQQAITKAQVKS